MKRPGEFSTENGTRGPNEVGQIAASAAVPDPDVLSSVVANELSQLSTEAREAAFHDLHGIPRNEDKTPDEINELINEVTDQLTRRRQKPAYAKALFLCPSYVNDPGFILMFLRAEDFDVKLAVKRIISHFEQKLQLFGIEKLARKITYEDFDEEDKVALHRGGTQILPYKDSSGRAIGIGLCEKMVSHTKIASQVRNPNVLFEEQESSRDNITI